MGKNNKKQATRPQISSESQQLAEVKRNMPKGAYRSNFEGPK